MVISISGLAHCIFIMDPYLFVVVSDQIVYYLFQRLYYILFRLKLLFSSGCELFQTSLEVYHVKVLDSSEDELFGALWVDVHGVVCSHSSQTFGD